jgi:hypothetical protein
MKGEGKKSRLWFSSMALEGIICHGRRKSVALQERAFLRWICQGMENRKGRAVNLSAIMLQVLLLL